MMVFCRNSLWKSDMEICITKTCLLKYTEFFTTKKWKLSDNKKFWYIYFCSKHCGYLLEPHRRCGSNKYSQSMFLSRNKTNNAYPCKPQFYYIKVGFKGVKIIQACFRNRMKRCIFVLNKLLLKLYKCCINGDQKLWSVRLYYFVSFIFFCKSSFLENSDRKCVIFSLGLPLWFISWFCTCTCTIFEWLERKKERKKENLRWSTMSWFYWSASSWLWLDIYRK